MERFTDSITARLTPKLRKALRENAQAMELSESIVVRLAIKEFLQVHGLSSSGSASGGRKSEEDQKRPVISAYMPRRD